MSKTSKLLIVILCIVITGAVAQYVAINRENNENIKIDSAESGQSEAGRPFKVGIVLSIGGLGDKSYNDLAYEGTRLAQEKLGIEFSYTEPATSIETEIEYGAHHLRQYAKEDYDLVIATGFLFKDACEKVA